MGRDKIKIDFELLLMMGSEGLGLFSSLMIGKGRVANVLSNWQIFISFEGCFKIIIKMCQLVDWAEWRENFHDVKRDVFKMMISISNSQSKF